MKFNLKKRLYFYLAIVFSIFTLIIFLVEHTRERRLKTEAIEQKLDTYTEIIQKSILNIPIDQYPIVLQQIELLFPNNLRISLIDQHGKVTFDNSINNWLSLENHLQRPEIQRAKMNKTGSDIRISESNNTKYLYFAKYQSNVFIRVALPYDIQIQRFFKSDNVFLYITLFLFVIVLTMLNRIVNIFGRSIIELRDFAYNPGIMSGVRFPGNEIGEIASEIAENYKQLRASNSKIKLEKEKLLQHIHNSKEGICFFSIEKKAKFYNALFLQYLYNITDKQDILPEKIFSDNLFDKLIQFIEDYTLNFKEFVIQKQGKLFLIRVVRFEDKSFEVIINDITKQEEIKQLKQQMVSNIAHELRTPVAGISGYLETILDKDLDTDMQHHFLTRAYNQTRVLTELIKDMSLINKIDEAGNTFVKEPLDIYVLLNTLKEDYFHIFLDNSISFLLDVPQKTVINGNQNLIQSIFKNLIDNAIRYGGQHCTIAIKMYKEDSAFYYFSFYDTGKVILDEIHLPKLFERFYRVEEGRTRVGGGSGLGLSIVKNAISIHGGNIIAKNRQEGGLEFVFTIHK